jgi:inositol transport system ATP-binding protein
MACVLKVENLSKVYPGVRAVDNISFELNKGEVLVLLGENGAGKSTLTKMICGVEKPDTGKIFVDEKEVSFESSFDAMKLGLSMVYQELSMVGSMSIAENIFMNRQPVNNLGGIKWSQLYKNTSELLEKFHLHIDPKTLVKKLSVGTQQLLEILKAISFNTKVIVLDEPTSSLAEAEVELLFENIKQLKAESYSFIYITHKISEVFRISDRIMIVRDGKYVDLRPASELNENSVVTMMVGREIKELYGQEHKNRHISEDYLFEVQGMSAKDLYSDISFGVKHGEILGFAGLVGAGRTEMGLGIFGTHKRDGGKFFMEGHEISIKNPSDAIKNKIAYLTEDRKKLGLYLNYSIKANMAATDLGAFSKGGIIHSKAIDKYADKQIAKFRISTPSKNQTVNNLSGGNQQKCLISMWMGINPDVFIMDEPTRGVDVGAKAEIYETIKNFADMGKAVVFISSELPELLEICDRIMVMHEGKITGEVLKTDFSEEVIMQYATGLR